MKRFFVYRAIIGPYCSTRGSEIFGLPHFCSESSRQHNEVHAFLRSSLFRFSGFQLGVGLRAVVLLIRKRRQKKLVARRECQAAQASIPTTRNPRLNTELVVIFSEEQEMN